MEYFTRRETVILTRISSCRLSYLARVGLVVPIAQQVHGKTELCYSWEQVLELRAIRHLRRQVSLQRIRKIRDFLATLGSDRALYNKHLIINNDEVTWVPWDGNPLPVGVQVAAKCDRHVGQLKFLPPSLWEEKNCQPSVHPPKVVAITSASRRVIPLRPH